MRTLLLSAALALCACGSVCDNAVAAERAANAKAKDCGLTDITVHDANKCNSNLQKCSSDDLKEIDNYATCLNNLPVCTDANKTSFNFSRSGCVLQPIGRLSNTCAGSIL